MKEFLRDMYRCVNVVCCTMKSLFNDPMILKNILRAKSKVIANKKRSHEIPLFMGKFQPTINITVN